MDQLMLHGMHLMQVTAQSIVRPGITTLLRFNSFHDTHIYVSYDRGQGGAKLDMHVDRWSASNLCCLLGGCEYRCDEHRVVSFRHFRLPTTCSCQFIVSAVSTDTVFSVGRCSAKAAAAQYLDEDVHILLDIFFQTERRL